MKIVARMISGKEICVEAFPVHTVNDVKRMIHECELIPVEQQRLFYIGTELDGCCLLYSCDILSTVNRLDLVVVPPDDDEPLSECQQMIGGGANRSESDSEYTGDSE